MKSISISNSKFSHIFDKEESSLLQIEETIEQGTEQRTEMQLSVEEMKMFTLELENLLNAQYIGALYLGSPKPQYAELSFDTGSNWLTVTSSLGAKRDKKSGAYDLKQTKTGYPVSVEIV